MPVPTNDGAPAEAASVQAFQEFEVLPVNTESVVTAEAAEDVSFCEIL